MTRTESGVAGRFIMGLSNKPIEKLSPIARSWLQTPQIRVSGGGPPYVWRGYSRDQRAFVLKAGRPDSGAVLKLEIAATQQSPLVNPAFVVKNWGRAGAQLQVDGRRIKRGKDFRFGHYHKLDGSDLIVWIQRETTKPTTISLSSVSVTE